MAKRAVSGREGGFYSRLVGDGEVNAKELEEEDGEYLSVNEITEDEGVYEVERVLERRKKGRNRECLVLWKGYRKDEASWVDERQVTAAALRTFTEPNPPERVVLDAVSSLSTAFRRSLNHGLIHNCNFNVPVRRDVFMYLFGDRGCSVSHKRGRLYNRTDFNDNFFRSCDFVLYNKHNEGVRVLFPVRMYSYVKCIRLNGVIVDYCETVSVTLIKECC